MARPIRLQFPGGTYHITSRGNNRSAIYLSTPDRLKFIELLGRLREKFAIKIYAYCLMRNHFHLLAETPRANLSRAMQYLNSAYTAYFNRAHRRTGHVLQGRYKSIVVDKEHYLLTLTRYIHLNPVAAKMVRHPAEYRWSSYRFYVGRRGKPDWLMSEEVLHRFGGEEARAIAAYRAFVEDRIDDKLKDDPLAHVWHQCLLGSQRFIDAVKGKIRHPGLEVSHRRGLQARDPDRVVAFIRRQRLAGLDEERVLMYFLRRYTDLTLREICERFGGGHYSRVSQAVKRFARGVEKETALRGLVRRLEERLSNFKV